jgi:hypothetical protein
MSDDVDEDQIAEELRNFVGTWKKVRLTRYFPGEPLHNGIVLAVGDEWVLLYQYHDFYPQGYTTLRIRDITDIRSGEYERHWERMLASEGLLDQIAVPEDVSLTDTAGLLKSLQQRRQNVIVECENRDDDSKDYYIGEILSVEDRMLTFAHFDALGRWEDTPHSIPLFAISKVQFDTPYVRTFSKYLKGPRRRGTQ